MLKYHEFAVRAASAGVAPVRWSVEVVIERPAVDDAEDFEFRSGETLGSEEECAAAIEMAKQIVDGRHPQFKVS